MAHEFSHYYQHCYSYFYSVLLFLSNFLFFSFPQCRRAFVLFIIIHFLTAETVLLMLPRRGRMRNRVGLDSPRKAVSTPKENHDDGFVHATSCLAWCPCLKPLGSKETKNGQWCLPACVWILFWLSNAVSSLNEFSRVTTHRSPLSMDHISTRFSVWCWWFLALHWREDNI